MPDRADTRNGEPVTLPLRCTVCGRAVLVDYLPGPGPYGEQSIQNAYYCPYQTCHKLVRIDLPGSLVGVEIDTAENRRDANFEGGKGPKTG